VATQLHRLLLAAVGLSLDNLGAGIGLGAMGFSLVLSLVAFGVVTALMTVLGLLLGQHLYRLMAGRRVKGVSGAVLFVTGTAMLVSRIHTTT
jgi:putative Mn2+ efflux pump MntP